MPSNLAIRADDKRLLRRKSKADRMKHQLFSFPPELVARLDAWKAAHPRQASAVVAELVDKFLTSQGY